MANDWITTELEVAMDVEELKSVHRRLAELLLQSHHSSDSLIEACMYIAKAIGSLRGATQ